MQTYLEIGEFCKLVHLSEDVVKGMMANGALNFKDEDGKIYIEANQGTFSVVPKGSSEATPISSISLAGESFVEKTIGTILNLHEKVLDAKDETLETLKNENKFLKDVLYSMQEIYDEDRKTIDILNEQLGRAQEEVEFLKRKYKLMWNKAVDNFTQGKMSATMDDMENSAFSPRSERNSSLNSSLNSALNSGANSNENSSTNSNATSENLNANLSANSALKAAASAALHAETPKSQSTNSTPKAENLSTTQSTANSNSNSNATSENSSLNSSASSTANSNATSENLGANSATNSSTNSNASTTTPQKDSAQ